MDETTGTYEQDYELQSMKLSGSSISTQIAKIDTLTNQHNNSINDRKKLIDHEDHPQTTSFGKHYAFCFISPKDPFFTIGPDCKNQHFMSCIMILARTRGIFLLHVRSSTFIGRACCLIRNFKRRTHNSIYHLRNNWMGSFYLSVCSVKKPWNCFNYN